MNSVIIVIIISGMHHWECVASNVDISFQSGRFWATSIASFRERLLDFRSCWIVLNVLLTAKITLLFVRIWPIYDLIDERHCWFTVSWGCVHTLCVLWAVRLCSHIFAGQWAINRAVLSWQATWLYEDDEALTGLATALSRDLSSLSEDTASYTACQVHKVAATDRRRAGSRDLGVSHVTFRFILTNSLSNPKFSCALSVGS